MTTELSLEIKPGEVEQIVGSVFETMLGLELRDGGTPWFPSADRVTAAVQMTGDWNGAVLFECDKRQACQFGALPFDGYARGGGRRRARCAGRAG
jgi:hypothetical protein